MDHHVRMSIVGFDGTFWGVILVRGELKKKKGSAVFVCLETTRTTKKRKEKKI